MKTQHKFLPALFPALALVALASCKRDLNLVSEDTISDATFWQTPAEFELAANTLYNGLDRFGFDDCQSDIAFNFPNSISNGSYLPTQTQGQWTTSYDYIRDCNKIIAEGATATDTAIKRYVGEAYFFRAWYYWKLIESFGGVPIITKVLNTGDTALYTPRSTQSQVVDFMLGDLTAAAAVLPLQSDLSDPDIGRVTKGSAEALAARLALYEGTWEKFRAEPNASHYLSLAQASAQAVMNSGVYALYTGSGYNSYRYNFIEAGDDSRECILDRRYARNILGQSYPYDCDGTGYNPTRKLADLYLDTTGLPITNAASVFEGYATYTSEYMMRDPRMTQTMTIPGTLTNRVFYPVTKVANWPDHPQRNFNTGYILYKYMSEDPVANNSGQNGDASLFDFDRHLIRYAEVLLIYAEATFELNDAISDADLDLSINVIRDRVSMPHLTNAFVTAHGLDMETEIRRERTVELALEGFRWDDVRRWKTAEVEMPEDVRGIKIKGTEWQTYPLYSQPAYQNNTDANGFMITETNRKFDPNKDYLLPLPTQEVALYTANGFTLAQNPGW
ncbi:MAG TPA: RagB/SusD family nutrient uptake outer membrane protein [Dinghuibacter sp.]|uniref:RagB/SusD family nutrient uptake outer membrane protein n=1 Tax=Dinghuibacter sp. TaxID=2024697 RepID=UPI002CAF28DF|nr:RagB/SusD family nutrient uptake outer membrane protein [Dinghuibacter sp.]HTJ11801.1 RagB/SusD family nutrient uptake outer membrane protein [Dinghuibacter sp.]